MCVCVLAWVEITKIFDIYFEYDVICGSKTFIKYFIEIVIV